MISAEPCALANSASILAADSNSSLCLGAPCTDDGNAANYLGKGLYATYSDEACLLDQVHPGAVVMGLCGPSTEQVTGAAKRMNL